MFLNILRYLTLLLPYLAVVAVLRILVNLPRRDFRKRSTLWHEIGVVVFAFYLIAVGRATLNLHTFSLTGWQSNHNYNLIPFAGISAMWNDPDRQHAFGNIFGNILMFAPLGFFLPLLWRKWDGARVFLVGMGLSVLIETVQLFTGRGTDIDDVILNTLGAVIGYAIFWILKRIAPRLVKAFQVKR